MHIEILNSNQQQLLPFIKKYKKGYYLVGGTAIALHIGHRHSVDFDLFTEKKINFTSIKKADLYFLIKDFYSINEISGKAKELFRDSFNPILFRKQLCYFSDINYSEQVDFLPGFETAESTIKEFLTEAALTGF